MLGRSVPMATQHSRLLLSITMEALKKTNGHVSRKTHTGLTHTASVDEDEQKDVLETLLDTLR